MKFAEAFFVLVLLAGAAVLVCYVSAAAGRAVGRWWKRHHDAEWEMVEESDGELVSILAERGDERLLIGAAPFAADDFDSRLYGLRAEGKAKVYTLNEGRR